MAKRRQIVLSRRTNGDADDLESMGKPDEVVAVLARFNTAPDGSPPGLGALTLHGPGMMLTMPTTQAQITQLIAKISEEEMAFPVLMRVCKALEWSMTDIETGLRFG